MYKFNCYNIFNDHFPQSLHALLNMSFSAVSLTKVFHAGMHIIIIVILNRQKQTCMRQ